MKIFSLSILLICALLCLLGCNSERKNIAKATEVYNKGVESSNRGNYNEAIMYYDEAIKITTEMPFRPELALTRLQLAELLLEHYPEEKPTAVEHLEFAIKEFREMKMQPSLERAQKMTDGI